jgi:hypothetical protein
MGLDKDTKLKLLRGALKLFGENGERWVKHKYRDELDGTFCLAGAIGEAAVREGLVAVGEDMYGDEIYTLGYDGTEFDQFSEFSDYLTEEVSIQDLAQQKGWENVPEFNDDGSTGFDDVRALVEERIAQLGKDA